MKRKSDTRRQGVQREDSDDELGLDDHPWTWVYDASSGGGAPDRDGKTIRAVRTKGDGDAQRKIVGAKMGGFECQIGDCVLLKAEGSNEAWVAIICEFVDNDAGEKAANFMWFSTEREIRNKDRKRQDFYWNELYVSPSWDVNPLATINGKATVLSLQAFLSKYPGGKVPRTSQDYGKIFICRRGCNSRTATYTNEFIWEDVYHGTEDDVYALAELVEKETKATRNSARRKQQNTTLSDHGESDYVLNGEKASQGDGVGVEHQPGASRARLATPRKKRTQSKKALEFTPLATRSLEQNTLASSPFQLARAQLHVASVPQSLPCREKEFQLVYSYLEDAITDGTGACIYISGTPGTGKTATVREVISRLEGALRADELDDFIFVEINGMKITDPYQSYSLLWDALRSERVSPSQALDLLEREFSHPNPRRVPCVVLMDELDQLVTRNQSVMYNFFNWPSLVHSRLIVLAVANTMDLPERTLSNKISSRLGLTRITFPGYNHEQLMQIIQSRLSGIPEILVEKDAIQFASRKVAAVSGDARRALDICRRAVELAEADSNPANSDAMIGGTRQGSRPDAKVTIANVMRAINEATSSPVQQYLRTTSLLGKLILIALVARRYRTGLVESTLGDLLEEISRALSLDANGRSLALPENEAKAIFGGPESRLKGVGSAALDLMEAGVVILEVQRVELPGKVRLAIGDDVVKLALRDDPIAAPLISMFHIWR